MQETIHALHLADVPAFFDALGLLPQLDAGELHCRICGDRVGRSNFGAALRHKGEYLLACDKADCALALAGLNPEAR